MKVKYRPSSNLPKGIVAALIEGEGESIILVDEKCTGAEAAQALDELIGDSWVPSSWVYVGDCTGGRGLHAVG